VNGGKLWRRVERLFAAGTTWRSVTVTARARTHARLGRLLVTHAPHHAKRP